MTESELFSLSYEKYWEILKEHSFKITYDLDSILGIKYEYSEFDPLDKSKNPLYVFSVVDPKKFILFKLKYGI